MTINYESFNCFVCPGARPRFASAYCTVSTSVNVISLLARKAMADPRKAGNSKTTTRTGSARDDEAMKKHVWYRVISCVFSG